MTRNSQPLRTAVFGLAVCGILFMSLWPSPYVREYVPAFVLGFDFLIHAVAYMVLSGVTLWALGRRRHPWQSRCWVWGGCVAFGFLMEIAQVGIPNVNRTFDAFDILANALGAFCGVALCVTALWPAPPKEETG